MEIGESETRIAAAFANIWFLNTSSPKILVMKNLSFSLHTSTNLDVFHCLECLKCLDCKRLCRNKCNSISYVFGFHELRSSDNDVRILHWTHFCIVERRCKHVSLREVQAILWMGFWGTLNLRCGAEVRSSYHTMPRNISTDSTKSFRDEM